MADFVRRALTLALACVVTGLGAWTAQAADPPVGALKVGTVDLQRVVDQYQKRKDMQEDLKKFKAGTEASLKDLQKQVDAVKGELDLLNEGSPDYDKKKRELEEKREILVLKGRLAEKEVVEKWAKGLETIYNEILEKTDKFREKAGYDLLLRIDVAPLKATTLEDMREHLNRKMVLSRSQAVDVTDALIKFINEP
jgi:Skp family chaperone for outer membrane proteins